MKQRIFIDTNIIMDLLSHRDPYYESAATLFNHIENGLLEGYASSLTFANLHYVLRKECGSHKTIEVLKNLRKVVVILPVDDSIIEQALNSGFKDFEDAIQYHVATANNLTCIVTRNLKDFLAATIRVCTAKVFLTQFTP
jgi:predicted nucleic acid-binding protein